MTVKGRTMKNALFVASYTSPSKASVKVSGTFEFRSDFRAGSRANARDARIQMLEKFGKDACPWIIGKIERAKTSSKLTCFNPGIEKQYVSNKATARIEELYHSGSGVNCNDLKNWLIGNVDGITKFTEQEVLSIAYEAIRQFANSQPEGSYSRF